MNFFVLNSQTSMNKIHREFHVALIKKYFIHMKQNSKDQKLLSGPYFLLYFFIKIRITLPNRYLKLLDKADPFLQFLP